MALQLGRFRVGKLELGVPFGGFKPQHPKSIRSTCLRGSRSGTPSRISQLLGLGEVDPLGTMPAAPHGCQRHTTTTPTAKNRRGRRRTAVSSGRPLTVPQDTSTWSACPRGRASWHQRSLHAVFFVTTRVVGPLQGWRCSCAGVLRGLVALVALIVLQWEAFARLVPASQGPRQHATALRGGALPPGVLDVS